MPRLSILLAAALAACAAAPHPASISSPGQSPSSSSGDAAFRDGAHAYAVRTQRVVMSWGTAHFAGDARALHYATLADNHPKCCGRGAYVLEVAPGEFVAMTFDDDGRTTSFHRGLGGNVDVGAKLPWETLTDTALVHEQTVHQGGEYSSFGIRDRQVVVLSYRMEDYSKTPLPNLPHEQYNLASAPPVRGHAFDYAKLAVSPVSTLDQLGDPVPTDPE